MKVRNSLPNFTAEASLYWSKAVGRGLLYDGIESTVGPMNLQATNERLTAAQLCPPCDECDPLTHKKECYEWRPLQRECATVKRPCGGSGGNAPSCPCPPGWKARYDVSRIPFRCYCVRS